MPMVFMPAQDEQPAAQYGGPAGVSKIYKGVPPLRESLFDPDPVDDARRVEFNKKRWYGQDQLLRGRDRQVEENVRMLCGQQWSVWNEVLGRHIDINKYLTDEERRWRQFPVINRLLLWYMLLHARLTENPPIITFQPATSDRSDMELAEVMDTVWKTLWHSVGMNEVVDDLVAWMIPGGRAYLKNRIDPQAGDLVPLQAPGMMQLLNPDGTPVIGADGAAISRYLDAAPYSRAGEPLHATIDTNGQLIMPQAESVREGAIIVDVLSPPEVRGQYGPVKWHRKTWHIHRTYCTPEEIYHNFNVEIEPEVFGDEADAIVELQRLHFGAGYYGQAGGREEVAGMSNAAKEGFVEVFEGWDRECGLPGMERTEDSPGGRLLITTRSKCLRDGARYAPFQYTSPIHAFDFVNLPGRPQGTSPQEMMNGPARSRNRFYAQVFQHTDLVANPTKMIDRSLGLEPGQLTNRPGQEVFGNFQGATADPIRYTRPPDLGSDVYKVLDLLTREMDDLGNIPGAEGRVPSSDPSGRLVKELRSNADRFAGPTARRMVIGLARLVEDWKVMLPLIWDQPKLLRVGGDENIAQSIMVLPQLFENGRINCVPDIESMLPEGRGEREARYWEWYQGAVFGPPGTPEATQLYLELSHFPHLNREALPGGVDRSTAQRENGQLLLGAEQVPVLQWYDHAVHLIVHYQFMKGQHYLKLPIAVQEAFVAHVQMHEEAAARQVQQQVMQEAMMQAEVQKILPTEGAPGQKEKPAASPAAAPAAA